MKKPINILSISLDKGLFDEKSDVHWRHLEYASLVNKYHVLVLTQKNEHYSQIKVGNLSLIPTNSQAKILYPLDCLQLALKHKMVKFTLVTTQDPFMTALAGILIKIFLSIPLNIQVHSDFFTTAYFRKEGLSKTFLYLIGRLTLLSADTVRSRNKKITHWLARNYKNLSGKIFYVPTPINKIFLAELKKNKRDPYLIVTNGRLSDQKNYPMLLSAFKKVHTEFRNTQLWIIGTGEREKQIRKMVNNLRLNDAVVFKGWIKPKKWKEILDNASVFVLASNHEGWGYVCLEALSRGTPVVMTNTGCAGEIVIDRKTGIVTPIGNLEKFTEGIIQVLRNPVKYQNMAKSGRVLVEKDSSPSLLSRNLLTMYQATINPT